MNVFEKVFWKLVLKLRISSVREKNVLNPNLFDQCPALLILDWSILMYIWGQNIQFRKYFPVTGTVCYIRSFYWFVIDFYFVKFAYSVYLRFQPLIYIPLIWNVSICGLKSSFLPQLHISEAKLYPIKTYSYCNITLLLSTIDTT